MRLPELRHDPLTGRTVILAPDRAARPNDHALDTRAPDHCPFCPGYEEETPRPVQVLAGPDGRWRVRAVPNKYPALVADGEPAGVHEVIIDSAQHVRCLSELRVEDAAWAVQVYRDRLRALRADGRFAYAQLFKNVGPTAGASLAHTHTQLLALPQVPETVRREVHFAAQHGGCPGCDLGRRELSGPRLVARTERYVAFAAFAARQPFETWLQPLDPSSDFADLNEVAEFAGLLHDVLTRLRIVAGRPDYNLMVQTAPLRGPSAGFHWRWELLPRLTEQAGFEWGTGWSINPVPPEAAAARLRDL